MEDNIRDFGGLNGEIPVKIAYGAPPEVKALVASRTLIQDMLLAGLVPPGSPVYIRATLWLQELRHLDLDEDLLSTDPKTGCKYTSFIENSIPLFKEWASDLLEVTPETSCNPPMQTWCVEHQEEHTILTEELFAGKLVELMGFLRCVAEKTQHADFELEGEAGGIVSYLAMIDEEQDWRDQQEELPEA